MISSSKIKYLVRKHPSLRFALVALFFLFIIMLLSLFSIQIHRAPVIKEINPSVGKPGDIIDITGKHFGKIRESSYVEFNGTRLTSSSYISWTDNEIKVLIPPNIQDGLVVVGSHNLRSKPAFFANEKDIPVLARQRQQSAVPFISEISKTTVSPGELLTIYGNNFGFQADDTSLVYFSSDRESLLQNVSSSPQAKKVSHIPASISDLDYEYWSDTEIRVFVPDGATSGNLYIETHYGKSGEHEITVSSKVGTKTFATQRTYVLQVVSDIDNISTKEAATIRFFVP
ncbi:MAG: IPT/TIG domain-containing protein, partial [Treponema sp.]|nr:IPT/TIG domain-containing protein [Treponema sp.]